MTDAPTKPEEIRSRKDRPTGSMHVGDVDFDTEDPAFSMDATWGDVLTACCVHDANGWLHLFGGICMILFFLYFFMVGLDFLGTGAQVMSGCTAGSLFGDDTNPVAGVMVGILATVLLQSSSTTTSMVVSLVGAGTVSVNLGIYMIMGANIGTSVTNTLVAMGHLGDGDQLERAFAGATVHDMFNFLSVSILFPIELISGYLNHLTGAMVKNFSAKEGEDWEGPIKKWVEPIGKRVIIENKSLAQAVAKGATCAEFYPIVCDDPSNPTKSTCPVRGLIDCDKSSDKCPAFFDVKADEQDDVMSGLAIFIIGLFMLFICLLGLVYVLQKMLLGVSTRIMYKATSLNGYVAILIGAGITILVQSSSVSTSAMTPLVGIGVLRLEQMYPLTLGANIGTTVTGLLAAMLSNTDAMQVALAHLFFNITGILIWYPIPFMRNIPMHAARQLGKATRIWKGFPIAYIATVFFLIPLVFLGLSVMFTQDSKGLMVMGIFLCIFLFGLISWGAYYFWYQGGKDKCYICLVNRGRRGVTMRTLPEDMEYLKAQIKVLREHTGIPEGDEETPAGEEPLKIDDGDDAAAKEQETEEAA